MKYDSLNRIERMCTSNGVCRQYYYEGMTDWIRIISENGVWKYHYLYANGRPALIRYHSGGTRYLGYDWHGNLATATDEGGGGNLALPFYGPFGEASSTILDADALYGWSAAWGYLHFAEFYSVDANWNNDGQEDGLYYVHGRWWNPGIGLYLSADEKGEYSYGSGQDAINWAWVKHFLNDAKDYGAGAGYQWVNDQAWGIPNAIWGTDWQDEQSYVFWQGQQGGRMASDWDSKLFLAKGGFDIAAGLGAIPPTLTLGGVCTGLSGGLCSIPTGGAIAVEGGLALQGVLESVLATLGGQPD